MLAEKRLDGADDAGVVTDAHPLANLDRRLTAQVAGRRSSSRGRS
jgi:hypothetical protein